MKVLAISYGKNFFEADNIERARMLECAKAVDELHLVVFSNKADSLESEIIEGKLFLHPTNSSNAIAKVVDAIKIGRSLLRQDGAWVITAQDCLITSDLNDQINTRR